MTKAMMSHEEMRERSEEIYNSLYNKCTARQKEFIDNLPDTQKRVFAESYAGARSYTKMVKAKCLDCSSFQREEVKNCTVETCALFKYRPYQG